jgi:hypothetical protein
MVSKDGSGIVAGVVVHVGSIEEYNGFAKRIMVIRTGGQYSQDIKCEVTGKAIGYAPAVGSVVEAHFNLKGRAYTNKNNQQDWFTNVNVWRIDVVEEAARPNEPQEQYSAPAQPQPAQATSKQQDAFDDVPF